MSEHEDEEDQVELGVTNASLTIDIDSGNQDVVEDAPDGLIRLLEQALKKLRSSSGPDLEDEEDDQEQSWPLMDGNGHRVGEMTVTYVVGPL